MKKIINILGLLTVTVLLVGCSESLEDTYANVSDGGKIRYVAKCSDIGTRPGWEKLVINWKNGTDATIDKIKLVWTYDGKKDSVLLAPLTTEYVLSGLYNTVYRFDIIAMDKEGNKSLGETTYGRPYTREHEIMNAFTRGVVKSYFVKDKMVFFADKWNSNISELKLQYKDTKGETKYYEFDENTYENLITIEDVSTNPEDIIYVLRKGKFEDSVDEIVFEPYPISRAKNFSSGFINAIERRYGYSTKTKEDEILFAKFVSEVEELEFDYNVETFEDILHCTNLKKLIFGKNRYVSLQYEPSKYKSLISGNEAKSKLIIEKAIELLGMNIEHYGSSSYSGSHYFKPMISGANFMGMSELPSDIEVIGKDAFREYENGNLISCTPSDPYAVLNDLLDNNYETRWETTSTQRVKSYEMYMELKESTQVKGIKIAQPYYDPIQDKRSQFFMPRTIDIETSIDGVTWQNVTFFKTNILGRSSGEITLLKFPEGKRAIKHIKISLQDGVDNNNNCMINLGDIVLYK